jgi:cytochrome c2
MIVAPAACAGRTASAAAADMVRGTIMMFPGLRKDDERKSLIEYLASPGG